MNLLDELLAIALFIALVILLAKAAFWIFVIVVAVILGSG